MASKTDTEVLIGGKVYTISGYESVEYIQKIVSYLNDKHGEYSKMEGYQLLTSDYKNVLMQINLADDFFKAKKQISVLEDEIKAKDEELYNLKHDLISAQIKLENAEKKQKELSAELKDKEKQLIRLEASKK